MSQVASSRRTIITVGMMAVATATIVASQAHNSSKARPYASQCTVQSKSVGYWDENGNPHEVARTPEISTWCP
jgi:hypothetical protein